MDYQFFIRFHLKLSLFLIKRCIFSYMKISKQMRHNLTRYNEAYFRTLYLLGQQNSTSTFSLHQKYIFNYYLFFKVFKLQTKSKVYK